MKNAVISWRQFVRLTLTADPNPIPKAVSSRAPPANIAVPVGLVNPIRVSEALVKVMPKNRQSADSGKRLIIIRQQIVGFIVATTAA